ncbi:aspartate beta-hydroxylase domain-containing protein 1 [Lissotriton helveticus]
MLPSPGDWNIGSPLGLFLSRVPSVHLPSEPILAVCGLLAALFVWYCYWVGRERPPDRISANRESQEQPDVGGGYLACQGTPGVRHPQRSSRLNSKLYHNLQDYAKRYSWSGMTRVHKGVRDQARYLSDHHRAIQKPKVFFLPDLPSAPYCQRDAQRHDVEVLERNFPAVVRDFEEIQWDFGNGGVLPKGWTAHPASTGGWHTFYLYRKGQCVASNCRSCPRTYRLLGALRTFVNSNIFGNACFSVLQPGTVLPGNYGPTNARVRCHLGVKVPAGCELVVGGEPQCWSEGHCLLVDDSFLHTTSHNGVAEDGPRVVFIVDLWHPNVAGPERQALDFIFAPGR